MRNPSRLLPALALALLPVTATAGEEGHRKAAAEFLEVSNMEGNLTQSMEQMLDFQMQQNPRLVPFRDTARKFLEKHMGWESLKEDFISIYMEEFTEGELKDLVTFYRTPTGRKAMLRLPQLMARGAQVGAQRVQENLPELQRMIEERAREIQEGAAKE